MMGESKQNVLKFLDSYRKEDIDVFFGRDREIEELYTRCFESNTLLVYGVSGVGKTSVVRCGLASRFQDADWLPIVVRRTEDLLTDWLAAIQQESFTPTDGQLPIEVQCRNLYLDHFKPLYFIFDQFEELFIFGQKEEEVAFFQAMSVLAASELNVKFILVCREEFLAKFSNAERILPNILSNRIRIEHLSSTQLRGVLEDILKASGREFSPSFVEEFERIIQIDSDQIDLSYFQVYLDHILTTVPSHRPLNQTDVGTIEDLRRVLEHFVVRQLSNLDKPESGKAMLKFMVSDKGTKVQRGRKDFEPSAFKLVEHEVEELLNALINARILTFLPSTKKYELRHDSVARVIRGMMSEEDSLRWEVEEFVRLAHRRFVKDKVSLTSADLTYVRPYRNRIVLTPDERKFIELEFKKAERFKEFIENNKKSIIAASIFLVLVLPAVVGFATNLKSMLQIELNGVDRIASRILDGRYEGDPEASIHAARSALRSYESVLNTNGQLFDDIWGLEHFDRAHLHRALIHASDNRFNRFSFVETERVYYADDDLIVGHIAGKDSSLFLIYRDSVRRVEQNPRFVKSLGRFGQLDADFSHFGLVKHENDTLFSVAWAGELIDQRPLFRNSTISLKPISGNKLKLWMSEEGEVVGCDSAGIFQSYGVLPAEMNWEMMTILQIGDEAWWISKDGGYRHAANELRPVVPVQLISLEQDGFVSRIPNLPDNVKLFSIIPGTTNWLFLRPTRLAGKVTNEAILLDVAFQEMKRLTIDSDIVEDLRALTEWHIVNRDEESAWRSPDAPLLVAHAKWGEASPQKPVLFDFSSARVRALPSYMTKVLTNVHGEMLLSSGNMVELHFERSERDLVHGQNSLTDNQSSKTYSGVELLGWTGNGDFFALGHKGSQYRIDFHNRQGELIKSVELKGTMLSSAGNLGKKNGLDWFKFLNGTEEETLFVGFNDELAVASSFKPKIQNGALGFLRHKLSSLMPRNHLTHKQLKSGNLMWSNESRGRLIEVAGDSIKIYGVDSSGWSEIDAKHIPNLQDYGAIASINDEGDFLLFESGEFMRILEGNQVRVFPQQNLSCHSRVIRFDVNTGASKGLIFSVGDGWAIDQCKLYHFDDSVTVDSSFLQIWLHPFGWDAQTIVHEVLALQDSSTLVHVDLKTGIRQPFPIDFSSQSIEYSMRLSSDYYIMLSRDHIAKEGKMAYSWKRGETHFSDSMTNVDVAETGLCLTEKNQFYFLGSYLISTNQNYQFKVELTGDGKFSRTDVPEVLDEFLTAQDLDYSELETLQYHDDLIVGKSAQLSFLLSQQEGGALYIGSSNETIRLINDDFFATETPDGTIQLHALSIEAILRSFDEVHPKSPTP